ncbi:MAG: high-potential iron-sulfur protein [Burkholderiales bacterium]|nr:high-potential iron-sulfur protein [Burkholderiales bacterium]
MQASRRNWLKAASGAAAAVPMVFFTQAALAAKNEAMRTSLKYKDTPEGNNRCDNCMQWVPGKTPKDRGGCKILPGDTEISPSGWCVAWVAAKK